MREEMYNIYMNMKWQVWW